MLLGAGPETHPKHRSQGHADSLHSLPAKSVKTEVLVTQSCLTLCDPTMDCSPPGSSVHGILQARTLDWVAMPSSRGSSRPRDRTRVFCITGCSLLASLFFVPGGPSHGPLLPHPPFGSDLGTIFHLCLSDCLYVCVSECVYVCVCVCVCMHARVFVCMYACV